MKILRSEDRASVEEVVNVLRHGGLVCFPTDTVYGVGAAAGDDAAVRRLFAAKGRPLSKPVPLLLADASDAARLAEVTVVANKLAACFWPGALTIVMRKAPLYRSLALAGQDTVALRVPDHGFVRSMVRALGEPVTGTSANRAGAPAPVSAVEAAEQVGEKVNLIIDGGRCSSRLESTVIDITDDIPEILREGVVNTEEVAEALGRPVRTRA